MWKRLREVQEWRITICGTRYGATRVEVGRIKAGYGGINIDGVYSGVMRERVMLVTDVIVEGVIERAGTGEEVVFGALRDGRVCMRGKPEQAWDRLRGKDALGILRGSRYMRLIPFRTVALTVGSLKVEACDNDALNGAFVDAGLDIDTVWEPCRARSRAPTTRPLSSNPWCSDTTEKPQPSSARATGSSSLWLLRPSLREPRCLSSGSWGGASSLYTGRR